MIVKKISKNVISIKDSDNENIIYVKQSYCSQKFKRARRHVRELNCLYCKKEHTRLNKIVEKQHEYIIELKSRTKLSPTFIERMGPSFKNIYYALRRKTNE